MLPTEQDDVKITMEIGADFIQLSSIISQFEYFIRACGFTLSSDSRIDIINSEDEASKNKTDLV